MPHHGPGTARLGSCPASTPTKQLYQSSLPSLSSLPASNKTQQTQSRELASSGHTTTRSRTFQLPHAGCCLVSRWTAYPRPRSRRTFWCAPEFQPTSFVVVVSLATVLCHLALVHRPIVSSSALDERVSFPSQCGLSLRLSHFAQGSI